MESALGGGGDLPVRSPCPARPGLRHRHAAADGERLAARRPRLLLHPHRRHRALPAHVRQGRLLPDGVGRQRAADRTPGAELLRRPLRSVAAVRSGLRTARQAGQAGDLGVAAELHRAVRAPDRRGREGVRGAVAPARALGRLVDDLRDDQPRRAARLAARLPQPAAQGPRLPARGADAVGHRLQDRRGPGRARGSRAARRVPQAALRPRRRHDRDRDDPARTAAGLRRPGRAPRRRALPAAVRHLRHDAAVQGAGADPGARAGQPRQGHRRGDDLHLRRSHRRHLVARAEPAGARHRAAERHAAPGGVGQRRLGIARRRVGAGRLRPARLAVAHQGSREDRRAVARLGGSARRAASDHARRQVLREGRSPARDHHQPAVVHPHAAVPRAAAGARSRAAVAPAVHAGPLRELGRRPER